jgi:hypothetical protein
VTRTRHFTRTAVFATSSALLAIAATGTAAAWTRSAAPVGSAAAPAAVATATPAVGTAAPGVALASSTSAPAPRALRPVVTTAAKAPVSKPTATTTAAKAPATKTAAKRVVISRYTYAPGSQKAIDQCKLVLWSTRPMWLAAHNYCGYQWLSSVPTGRTIVVSSGKAKGTYVVTGHLRLSRQSGSMPVVKADLVLQTCVGSGTGLTLARRVR